MSELYFIIGSEYSGKHSILEDASHWLNQSENYFISNIWTTKSVDKLKFNEVHKTKEDFKIAQSMDLYNQDQDDTITLIYTWKDNEELYGIPFEPIANALMHMKKTIIILPIDLSFYPTIIQKLEPYYMKCINFQIKTSVETILKRKNVDKDTKDGIKILKNISKGQYKFEKFLSSSLSNINLIKIKNEDNIDDASHKLLAELHFNPDKDIIKPDSNNLKTCLPQDYLKQVDPYISPGLTLLNELRPADPIN